MPQTRHSVIAGLPSGNESAWHTFFSIYAPIAYAFARKARLSDHDAQDVVANVMKNMMVAFRGGFRVDYTRGKFRYYLRRVINHEISAQRRRRGPAAGADPQEDRALEVEHTESFFEELEQAEILRCCMVRLRALPHVPARDVELFEKYVLQNVPVEQLAKEYAVSKSRIYVIKHQMVNELRSLTQDLTQDLTRL